MEPASLIINASRMDSPVSYYVYNTIVYSVYVGIALSVIILVIGSVLVHDTYYISKNPKFFISETLIMGILTAVPVFYIAYIRENSINTTNVVEFFVIFMKIAFIHVGLQLSGVYSAFFPKSAGIK